MANTLALEAYYDSGGGSAWTAVGATDKAYFQASGAFAYGSGGAITVGEYNGGTHIINASNTELCTTAHPANIEYSSDVTHYKKDGGAETAIDATHPATTDCFRLHGACSPNAEVTASYIYAYGATEADAVSGATVYAVQPGVAAEWEDIGGSGNSKSLGTSVSAADHYLYIAITVTPTSNGAKSGTLKGSMTFV